MTKAHSLKTLVVFLSCLLLAGGAFAAEMVGFGDGASWNLDKADFGGVMTISGPADYSMQKAFGAGEAPSFSVWNKAGYALADGQYNWNITLNAAKAERGDAASDKAATFSGSFRIQSGSIVVPKASGFGDSDAFNKDQVFLDDLIVQGSICAGQDCSNGESFGFDTLRLKENNLRIKAQDTSTSASFPTVDWQITFNDSSNGGANKFAIDDIDGGRTPFTIEAGARTNALYVEADGQIGIGTNSPVVNIHVKEGNTPTLRLEQDGSSGFTPQTWDLAGNETNFFVRDATNGSSLPFRIFPGNGNDDALAIAADGDIGLGTTSPNAALHVVAGGATFGAFAGTAMVVQNNAATSDPAIMTMLSGSASNAQINFGDSTNEFQGRILYNMGTDNMDFRTNGTTRLQVNGTGGVTIDGLAGGGNQTLCVDNNGLIFATTGSC